MKATDSNINSHKEKIVIGIVHTGKLKYLRKVYRFGVTNECDTHYGQGTIRSFVPYRDGLIDRFNRLYKVGNTF